jgi:hypothetical protein
MVIPNDVLLSIGTLLQSLGISAYYGNRLGAICNQQQRHFVQFVADLNPHAGIAGHGYGTKKVTKRVTSDAQTEQVLENDGGRQGIRTPDPRVANAMLSQLS